MRKPSSFATLYQWWRSALNDPDAPRHEGNPQCGFYKTKLVRNGPWVPVEICCHREIDHETGELASDEKLVCSVAGERRDPGAIWSFLRPISRAEFAALSEANKTNPRMRATMVPVDLTEGAVRP